MFNKTEYNMQYRKDNVKRIELVMSKDEYELFNAYCTKLDINRCAYLKMLVDNDAISRGYNAIFGKDKRFRKVDD